MSDTADYEGDGGFRCFFAKEREREEEGRGPTAG